MLKGGEELALCLCCSSFSIEYGYGERQESKSDEFCKFVWDLEFSLFYGNFIFWVVKKERNHGGN